ncbi:uncharacterized protein [Miscanthus floridulus]|uniref:uncharacterized protein n=1 Tax=Miscanthus floridulus TaxID=154761 RepID=UPI003457B7CE
MPLYKLLKKTNMFVWTEEAQQALESLKASLTLAPILVALELGEPLLLYIVASKHMVSAALVIKREEPGHTLKVQRPVYFVSEVLTNAKKLLHYITNHEVTIVTSYPLGEIIRNRDTAGRISKWALELMGHDIRYIPHTMIKSQALADFIAEWTEV